MILTKGNTIFIAVMYMIWVIHLSLKTRSVLPAIPTFVGFAAVLTCWMLFANYSMYKTKEERTEWLSRLEFSSSYINAKDVNHPPFFKPPYTINDTLLMMKKMKHLYSKYAEDGFIIFTKQLNWCAGEEMLGVHNEITAIDGWIHEEWRFVNTLYHNNFHQDRHPVIRILYFYLDNPKFIYLLPLAKFKSITLHSFPFFMMSILLLGGLSIVLLSEKVNIPLLGWVFMLFLLIITQLIQYGTYITIAFLMFCVYIVFQTLLIKKLNIPPVLIFAISNNVLIIVIFFGVNRFAEVIDPIVYLLPFMLCFIAIRKFLILVINR
jgi:hypothetical protein